MLYDYSHTMLKPVPTTEREQWDRFVNEHPHGHLLQSWAWGELKETAGWSPLRLALWNGDRIVAAAQILRRGAPRLPLRLGHLAYIPKGPVLDWSQLTLCEAFFSRLIPYLRAQGAIALRMEFEQEDDSDAAKLVLARLQPLVSVQSVPPVQPLRTIVLDTEPEEQQLLAQMKEKWRYNVRLAGRKGVTVRVAQSVADVQAWYTILRTTSERDKFGIHALAYYEHAWRLFANNGQAQLLLAEHEGQLLAGIFVGLFAHKAIYLYGASSNEQRQLMPNYLLQWEAIRWTKGQGARSYDFWGIPDTDDEDEAMAGVYRFKRGWGGRVVRFMGCYEHVYRPVEMQLARQLHFV